MTQIEDKKQQHIKTLFMLSGAKKPTRSKEKPPKKPKSKMGGFRPGSGRPKGSVRVPPELKRITMAITVPRWLAESLTDTDVPPGRLIEAIIEFNLASLKNLDAIF